MKTKKTIGIILLSLVFPLLFLFAGLSVDYDFVKSLFMGLATDIIIGLVLLDIYLFNDD